MASTHRRNRPTVTITLPPQQVALLQQLAADQERTLSWLIEKAIAQVYQPPSE